MQKDESLSLKKVKLLSNQVKLQFLLDTVPVFETDETPIMRTPTT